VAAALKEFSGKIRLVQTTLPGFRFQQGFTSWRFLTMKPKAALETLQPDETFFEEYQAYD